MNHRMNVPPDLQHLIEKREQPDRRSETARASSEAPSEATGGDTDVDAGHTAGDNDRQAGGERRRRIRREQDRPDG